MKYFAVIFVSLLLVDLSFQYVKFNECSDEQKAEYASTEECSAVTCSTSTDGRTLYNGVGCAAWLCGGELKGYKEQDDKMEYPDCCPGPICQ